MKMFRRKFFYARFTADEFMEWQYDMHKLGLSVSAWQGDYGKATCLNCRAVVDIGVPDLTGFAHGIEHRRVCGDRHLGELSRRDMSETIARLSAASRWPINDGSKL